MYNKFVSALYLINIIAQAIFTLLFSPALLFFIAWLLVTHLSLPEWIYAIAIILGFFVGLFSMIKFLLVSTKSLERLEAQRQKSQSEKKNNPDNRKGEDEK